MIFKNAQCLSNPNLASEHQFGCLNSWCAPCVVHRIKRDNKYQLKPTVQYCTSLVLCSLCPSDSLSFNLIITLQCHENKIFFLCSKVWELWLLRWNTRGSGAARRKNWYAALKTTSCAWSRWKCLQLAIGIMKDIFVWRSFVYFLYLGLVYKSSSKHLHLIFSVPTRFVGSFPEMTLGTPPSPTLLKNWIKSLRAVSNSFADFFSFFWILMGGVGGRNKTTGTLFKCWL